MSVYRTIYNLALKMKSGTEHLSYGREIISRWCKEWVENNRSEDIITILDIGCGKGDDLLNMKKIAGEKCEMYGLESLEDYRKECERKGIKTVGVNIERDRFPFEDNYFDIVLINQVLEHTKDVFYVLSEISRILKTGGMLMVGVPNLATWHDRLILLLGNQPSGMKIPGPHVRGFTIPAIKNLLTLDDYFRVDDVKGAGFYPFPIPVAKTLSRLLPSMATAVFCKCKRTEKEGKYIDVLKTRFYETDYYTGE